MNAQKGSLDASLLNRSETLKFALYRVFTMEQ